MELAYLMGPDYVPIDYDVDYERTEGRVAVSQDLARTLHETGHDTVDFFKEGLKVSGFHNPYSHPEAYKNDFDRLNLKVNERVNEQLKNKFIHGLTSIRPKEAAEAAEAAVKEAAKSWSILSDPRVDQNKKLTANVFNRRQLMSILRQLIEDVIETGAVSAVHELSLALNVLEANKKREFLSIREKAKISLSFEKVSAIYQVANNGTSEAKEIATIIRDMQFRCYVQYVASAHEIITNEFAQDFQKQWQLGFVRSETYKGSAGVATPFSDCGLSLGGSINGTHETLNLVDPEGYLNKYKLNYGGLSFDVKAALGDVEVPGLVTAKLAASGSIGVQAIHGKFTEPKTPLAHATRKFQSLIKEAEHRNNPKTGMYYSRARLLCSGSNAHDVTEMDAELVYALNEVQEIDQLLFEFNAKKALMDKRLVKYTNDPKVTSSHIKVAPAEVTKSRITGCVGKLSVGAEAKVGFGMDQDKGPGLGLSVYGFGEWLVRYRDDVKRTPIGRRYADPIKNDQEKTDIKCHIKDQFEGFKDTLIKNWNFPTKKNSQGENYTFDVTDDELKKCAEKLIREFKKYSKLHAAEIDQAQKERGLRKFERRYGATRPEALIHRMHVASLYLLTNSKDENLDETLLEFEKTLLSPYFAVDKNYLDEHLNFIEDLRITYSEVKFELEVKGSVRLFGNKENVTTEDGANVGLAGGWGPRGKFKLKATYGQLSGHSTIIRRGPGLELSMAFGGGVNVEATIKAVAPEFYKHLPADFAQYALDQLQEKLLAEMALSGSVTWERTRKLYVAKPDKFSEDSEDFSLSHYFERRTKRTVIEAGGKITIPTGLLDIKLGAEYVNISTDPVKEICGSNTLFQFITLAMPEYHCDGDYYDGINKITGIVKDGSRWQKVRLKQEDMLKKLFSNFANEFANEPEAEEGKRPHGDISRELVEIEKAINNNKKNYLRQLLAIYLNERKTSSDPIIPIRIAEIRTAIIAGKNASELDGNLARYNFGAVKEKFKAAAIQFEKNQSPKNYQQALDCFEDLMFAYYPQWSESKSNAPDLKPRPLAIVEDVNAGLTARIRQAQLMQSCWP